MEIFDVYLYMNLIGNLGTTRRSLVNDVFNCRTDVVLNYNVHPSSRAGISQIICQKRKVQVLVDGLKEKKIPQLPRNYNPLGLSPRGNHLGPRRTKELRMHRIEVMRYWQRNANSPRDETVAQLFENLLAEAKRELQQEKKGKSSRSGERLGSGDGRQPATRRRPKYHCKRSRTTGAAKGWGGQ